MKKKVLVILAIFLGLTSCQLNKPTTPETKVAGFRVALLLPRNIEADAWTRSGYQGLLLIEEELGAEISFSENIPEADFEKVFRQYALDGYDFIIGHGNQFLYAAEIVSAEFPLTAFAIDGKYGGNNINLGSLSLREGEMSYLLGTIAAIKTESKHVSYIGGMENPSQLEAIEMYKRGIVAIDSSVQVTVDFVGNFTDNSKGSQIAENQINAGVDVILNLAGAAGLDIFPTAEQAGIYSMGWSEDLNYLAPTSVLTSNVQDIPQMILSGAILVKQGRWEGKQYRFGLAEGMAGLAPFYGLITPEEEIQINMVLNALLGGEIDLIP